MPISFAEAALGTDLRVPTLTGDPVTVRLPPGTSSGRTFRVRKRGVARRDTAGDLLVSVEVAVPATLIDAEADREMSFATTLIDDIRSARAQVHVPVGLKADLVAWLAGTSP